MAETEHDLARQKTYDPNALLDTLIERLQLKNDAALCRLLEVGPPVISKIRHKRLPIGSSMLLRMHEISNLTIRELRYLMGDRRSRYRENAPPHSKIISEENHAPLNE